jgi:hypothetical protein
MLGPRAAWIHFIWHSKEATRVSRNCSADPNACGVDGQTLLHVSSQTGHLKAAQGLLKLDVDINLHDNEARTPLQVALESGRKEVVQFGARCRKYATSSPLQGADAETQVRLLVLNDPGSSACSDYVSRYPEGWRVRTESIPRDSSCESECLTFGAGCSLSGQAAVECVGLRRREWQREDTVFPVSTESCDPSCLLS